MTQSPRPVADADMGALARIWHDGWHRAHAAYVPADLTAMRVLGEFESRLPGLRDMMRVVGPAGAPLGLCAVRDDELNQIYVAPEAQGTGAAAALLADGEARIAAAGHDSAWLICVPENARAIAFYSRQGWINAGQTDALLDTSNGQYAIRLMKMTKTLAGTAP